MRTRLTTIPRVSSGYIQLDFAKDMGVSYNTTVLHGNLVHGYALTGYSGIADVALPSSVLDVWYLSSSDTTVVLCDNGYVTTVNSSGSTTTSSMAVQNYSCSTLLDYNTCSILISGSSGYMYNNGTLTVVDNMPQFDSMASHKGRVFGVAGNRVSYCKILDATNWSQSIDAGGYIDMPSSIGKCHTIISRGDYLYVMGDNGIVKLYASSDPRQFSLTVMTSDVTDVCSGTAVLCGDNIWWLSSSGVYQIDGTTVKRMLTLDDNVNYSYDTTAHSAYYQGKLILPIRADFADNTKVGCEYGSYICNALLVVDTHQCTYQLLRGIDALRVRVASGIAVVANGSSVLHSIGSASTQRQWCSRDISLGAYQHKRIDSVAVSTRYPITLKITSGTLSRSYCVEAGCHRVPVRLRGSSFGVSVGQSCTLMHIDQLGIYYTTFGKDKIGG